MEDKHVSRRDFLKIAGVAGATIGLGAGLGGLVAACGGTEETTTTATAQATTTTAAASTTTARLTRPPRSAPAPKPAATSFWAWSRPSTGPLALFAKADDWWVDFAHEGRCPTASSAATARST